MVKKVLLGIVVVLAAFVILVETRPAEFRIERSRQIHAPAPVVFAQVNDFKNWRAWSPWEQIDPNMTRQISDPSAGVGATYAWSGNAQAGAGRMTITESTPNEKIGIALEFIKPWKGTNSVTFLFDSRGQETTVRWVMEGTNAFMAKAIGLVMDMDTVIGGEFEKGLAQMQAVAEAEQRQHTAATASAG